MDHLLSKENVAYIMVCYTLLVIKMPIKISLVLYLLVCLILFSFERLC